MPRPIQRLLTLLPQVIRSVDRSFAKGKMGLDST
ncbi:uncharacterized protein METZ01_LOCUS399170, partial [marine metagenome]